MAGRPCLAGCAMPARVERAVPADGRARALLSGLYLLALVFLCALVLIIIDLKTNGKLTERMDSVETGFPGDLYG